MSAFEVLRDRVDLVEVARKYTEMHRSGKAHIGRCPHPDHEDRVPSFHVYPDGHFYCYGCRWHGDVVDLWAAVKVLKPGLEAALDLGQEHGIKLPETSTEAREEAEHGRRSEAQFRQGAKERHEALAKHPQVIEWWEERGFDEGLREQFLLGVGDDGAEAIIPFWYRGSVQGLIRRKLSGTPMYALPKAEEFPEGCRPLFIPGAARDAMFLVEGFVDALALAALGYAVAAIGGTHANRRQKEELQRLPGPLYVLPDADEEGAKAAREWVRELYPKALFCPPKYEKEENHDN